MYKLHVEVIVYKLRVIIITFFFFLINDINFLLTLLLFYTRNVTLYTLFAILKPLYRAI